MTRSRPRRPADRGHLNAYGRHGHGRGYSTAGGTAVRETHCAERHDRRRERRMRRRHGRHGGNVLMVVLGAFLAVAVVTGVVVWAVVKLIPYLFLAALLAGGVVLLRRSFRRSRAVDTGPGTASAPSPEVPLQAWRRAKADFDRLRVEYSAHECDPMQVLRRPALSDVSVPSTARFVDAFAEAQSLDTDNHPGAPYDAAFTVAVAKASRAWQAALDAADRIRLSGVPTHERGSIERVLKLLTTARDSDSEHERLVAYSRARSELDRLDRAGVVHLPRTARAAVDEAARGALPG
ncbi:hypothetical protein [Pseudonocardia sp. KRD291]|uniref:hypothetical protein n=1 Tax=Pseudonocardia sp. KRD291 TaxID=2792007 RepID=UPI001C49E10D|nr:hypothetical protein [Pseudonocardia sp. KRD291]MBW0105085.1 hypothetical protein [Pseudonocardia sp. KRD291]